MYAIEVEPVCVELGRIKIKGKEEFTLRRFQESTVDFFKSSHFYFFLSAPTGSGKTFTLLAPLLSNVLYGTRYDGMLGIYPTKPLTVDQLESLKFTLGKLGNVKDDRHGVTVYDIKFEVISDIEKTSHYKGKVGLVLLTRDNIEKLRGSLATESGRNVLDAIRKVLLTEDVDYLITLAVPEYPYLMFSHMYRSYHDLAKILDLTSSEGFVYRVALKMLSLVNDKDGLRKYSERIVKSVKALVGGRVVERELADLSSALLPPVLFFDEFHTWGFYELPTAITLVLLHRLVSLTSTRREMYRVVFSSATPNQYVADMLRKVAGESSVDVVEVKPVDCGGSSVAKVRGRTTIELHPVETKMRGALTWVELDNYLPSVVKDKAREILKHERAIVFGRHVWSVEKSAEKFYSETRAVPTVVTGIVPPQSFHGKDELVKKKASGELYVFGNYAVELGVDLQNIRYSIVVASNLGELIQRMGRSGRGGIDSKVVVPIPDSYADEIIRKLGKINGVQYSELVEAFSWVMPDEHIVKKLGNKVVMMWKIGKLRMYLPLATYVLVSFLRYRDKPLDLEPILREFVNIVQLAGIDDKFSSWLSGRVSKKPEVLVELASFRLSPSVPYVRAGSANRVDGESNPVTLLSNYDVELDTSGGFKVVIKNPMRRRVKDVTVVEMRSPDRNLLSSLDGSILPSRLALELVGRTKISSSLLTEILRRLDTPIYFVYTEDEDFVLETLRAHGQAIALEHSGVVYVYMLLL
ncbi:MAG: DEAD/DEAH box helicase [Sulfolobales archaeon]